MRDLGYPKLVNDALLGIFLSILIGAGVYGALNAAARVNHAYKIARV